MSNTQNAIAQFKAILATPTRYMNNAFGRFWNMVPKNPQDAIFLHGDQSNNSTSPDETPIWIYSDVPSLDAYDTEDMRIGCPDNFELFGVNAYVDPGSTVDFENGGFRLQLYDVNRKIQLIKDHPVNFQNYCGVGNNGSGGAAVGGGACTPLILRDPYPLEEENAQILVRVGNLEASAYPLQVVLFGYQSGGAV